MELLRPNSKYEKKNHPQKNSLYFKKWNFLTLRFKVSYIFSIESFSYISGNGTLHFLSSGLKNKKIYPEKILYISGNGNFLYFLKRKFFFYSRNGTFLIFQEMESTKKFFIFQETELFHISYNGNLKKTSYISGSSSPSSKNKKNTLKKFLIFREMDLYSPPKKLIKLFYTLNKNPLGETGCSSTIYDLLAAQAYSFLIHSQSWHLWYPLKIHFQK